ncbi:F-actin-capping protein subunit alpha-2-like [Hemicordylus capensis]|uniref:F-actin-capping protein subunit alpha-2-like n=1 Tax=Hemicordylus capensis TaxID=884348 RepID=UPI002302DA94|nr:F-actin-capping protein subunit alpha-2-like [Hemicordylus capensis]XP_053128732.1 F-actin-capping protein subunit alpha-2-like [Hemicordylus capensis]XP_053128733.1 F-actin-capping protein subunit alpha-2-like [Hemicordylus capensis]XP_053128734.1 F-actin-capping protein subunit alpha-2-like [Hemicordylus capensis]
MSKEDTPGDHPLSGPEKVQVVSRLLKQAPPGEFTEAFSDLRLLVDDDAVMGEEVASLCAVHDKDHFTPIRTQECEVLLTRHNELEENRFLDPQGQVSFKYDHLKRKAGEFQPHPEEDEKGELWRRAIQESLKAYVRNHYPEGVCSVFIKDTAIRKIFVACIESHRYRPSAFWNGLWKSEWTFALVPVATSTPVTGSITVQAHYFEDGNTHLTVARDVEETLLVTDEAQTAQDFVKLVEKAESAVQGGLMEEYQLMNGTYLKSFRRQLPITHTTLDWEKVATAKVLEARVIQ